MFSAFLYFTQCYSSKQCYGQDIAPIVSGNAFTEYVSDGYIPNLNLREETPVEITEVPTKKVTLNKNKIAEYIISNKLADKATAEKIQKRLEFSSSMSTAYNTFDCNDMSINYKSLPKDQKNANNFWNKIITRSALLVKATNNGENVDLQLKKVTGQMKKRWAKVSWQDNTFSYSCTVTEDDCGLKDVQEYGCETVTKERYDCHSEPYTEYKCTGWGTSEHCGYETSYQSKCGYYPVQEQECGYHTVQKYRCDQKTHDETEFSSYLTGKLVFTDSFNKTEVEDMFNSVQKQMLPKLKF